MHLYEPWSALELDLMLAGSRSVHAAHSVHLVHFGTEAAGSAACLHYSQHYILRYTQDSHDSDAPMGLHLHKPLGEESKIAKRTLNEHVPRQ